MQLSGGNIVTYPTIWKEDMWGIEIYSWELFDGHVSKLTWEELLMGSEENF